MAATARRELAPLAALAVLWLVHAGLAVAWLARDTRPATYDTAGHAIATLTFADHLAAGAPGAAVRSLLGRDYPPLLYLAAAPVALAGGRDIDALTLAQLPFLALLLAATYGIARQLAPPGIALLAGAVVSAYPYVYGLARQLLVDLPLAATVALALFALLRAGELDDPRRTLALGGAIGLGLLAKTTFAEFLLAPALLVAARACRRHGLGALPRALPAVVPPLLLAGWWYVPNLGRQLAFVRFQSLAAAGEGDPTVLSAAAWRYYLNAAAEVQVMAPLLAAGLAAAVAVAASRRFRSQAAAWTVLLWLAVPYVLLALQPNKDPRYSLPLLPALAVLTAWGASLLRPAWRAAALAPLGLWAALQLAGLTCSLRPLLPGVRLPVMARATGLDLVVYSEQAASVTAPRAEDWHAAAIVADLARAAGPTPAPQVLTVLPDAAWFEPNVFMLEARARSLDWLEVRRVTGVTAVADARGRVAEADFVVAKSGDQGPAWTVQQAAALAAELADPASTLGARFAPMASYPLPDRSTATLYRRR